MNGENDKPKVTGKALQVNNNSAGGREPSSPKKSRKVEGNALRVNDNSVEGEEPAPFATPPTRGNDCDAATPSLPNPDRKPLTLS